jgi:uncharacterized protein (UPF0332 family)
MQNKIDVFSEIKNSAALYDPTGFFVPLQRLVEKGKILGTKENLTHFIVGVRKRLGDLREIKLRVLSSIYEAVIDAGQAPLIAANYAIPVQRGVAPALEKRFVKRGLLAKRYLDYFNDIVNYFKDFEHEKISKIEGKKLDDFTKKAILFIDRMEELSEEVIESRVVNTK